MIAGLRTVTDSELSKDMRQGLSDLRRFTADHKYFQDNWDTLLAEFDGQWVAVYNGRVVAHDRELPRLVDLLQSQEMEPSAAAICLVTSEKRLLFF